MTTELNINFASYEIDDSDASSEDGDEMTPLEQHGYRFRFHQQNVGNLVRYDTYARVNDRPYRWDGFQDSLLEAFDLRVRTFRNIVLTLVTDRYMHRRISLTNRRLKLFGDGDMRSGLLVALNNLRDGNYLEIYDEYDEEKLLSDYNLYGEHLDAFHVDTSTFDIAYDRENVAAGGAVYHLEYSDVIFYEAPMRYDVDECFFDCVHESLDLKENLPVEEIKKAVRGTNYRYMKIKHLKRFEKLTGIKVVIYYDEIDVNSNKPHIMYPGNSSLVGKIVELVYKNNHFLVYKGILEKNTSNIDIEFSSEDDVYMFYDFETYIDPKTKLQTYTMSYKIVYKNMMDRGVIIKDILEDDLGPLIHKLFSGLMDKHRVLLIGYNNGAFDDYFLINIFSKYSKRLNHTFIDRRNKILSFKYDRLVSKDAIRFFATSLRKATESFKCSVSKGVLDHREVQHHVDNGTFHTYMKENSDKITEYALGDVDSLCELYFKAKKTFLEINKKFNMDECITISQMSMRGFRDSLSNDRALPILNKEQDDFVRKCMVGGRCEMFKIGIFEDDEQSVDMVSLYPNSMLTNKYPILRKVYDHRSKNYVVEDGWFKEVDEFMGEDYIGFYKVFIIRQPIMGNVIPYVKKDGTYDWDFKESFETYSDSVSLNLLLKYGGEFRFIEGYCVDTLQEDIFTNFLQKIMVMKELQDHYKDTEDPRYNPALRECLKLIMNALSGKMGQRPVDEEKHLTDSDYKIDKIISSRENASIIHIKDKLFVIESEIPEEEIQITSPTILAVLIYAYSRKYMYENLIVKVSNKYGMDTDSLFFDMREVNKIDKKLFGSSVGQLKFDLDRHYKWFYVGVAKKIYSFYRPVIDNKDSKDKNLSNCGKYVVGKFKFKGVNFNDKYIENVYIDEVKLAMKEYDYVALREIYKKLPAIRNNVRLLKKLVGKDKILILCSQIRRDFKTNFEIYDNFLVKEFDFNFYENKSL